MTYIIPYCLAPVVANEVLNLRDTVIFNRTVQPWTPEPKKGDDTELKVKMVELLDTGRTWERVFVCVTN